MRIRQVPPFLAACVAVGALYGVAVAQRMDAFVASRDHPAIEYSKGPVTDRIAELNRRLEEGRARLAFDPAMGYLRSVLETLKVPVES